jgi:hypothetical protein
MNHSVVYYDYDPEATVTCGECSWFGRTSQASRELFRELMTLHCPQCDRRLMTVVFPTIDETRAAAEAGNLEALKALPDLEAAANRAQRAEQLHLRSPDQLPDLPVHEMRLDWDLEEVEEEKWTVVRWGPVVVWRELAYWEGYERFIEIVRLLRRRYGRLLREVRPTSRSELYLYGDSLTAPSRVQKINDELTSAVDSTADNSSAEE